MNTKEGPTRPSWWACLSLSTNLEKEAAQLAKGHTIAWLEVLWRQVSEYACMNQYVPCH